MKLIAEDLILNSRKKFIDNVWNMCSRHVYSRILEMNIFQTSVVIFDEGSIRIWFRVRNPIRQEMIGRLIRGLT